MLYGAAIAKVYLGMPDAQSAKLRLGGKHYTTKALVALEIATYQGQCELSEKVRTPLSIATSHEPLSTTFVKTILPHWFYWALEHRQGAEITYPLEIHSVPIPPKVLH
jgi:hypothetical protein